MNHFPVLLNVEAHRRLRKNYRAHLQNRGEYTPRLLFLMNDTAAFSLFTGVGKQLSRVAHMDEAACACYEN